MSQQGTATLDFGAFPGASDASVLVTGVTGSPTLVEAWLYPAATADHSADEHWVESIEVKAGAVSGGQFTIYGKNTNNLGEPTPQEMLRSAMIPNSATVIAWRAHTAQGRGFKQDPDAGKHTRLYGQWNVGWVAN